MNDDTFVESSFRFFLNNWFDVMLVFAFLLLLLSFVYINKAKAAHGDPTLFENKVKDQLYHRTIVLKPGVPDVTSSLKQGLSIVEKSNLETDKLNDLIDQEKEKNEAVEERDDARAELARLQKNKETFTNLDGTHIRKKRERNEFPLQNDAVLHRDRFYYKN